MALGIFLYAAIDAFTWINQTTGKLLVVILIVLAAIIYKSLFKQLLMKPFSFALIRNPVHSRCFFLFDWYDIAWTAPASLCFRNRDKERKGSGNNPYLLFVHLSRQFRDSDESGRNHPNSVEIKPASITCSSCRTSVGTSLIQQNQSKNLSKFHLHTPVIHRNLSAERKPLTWRVLFRGTDLKINLNLDDLIGLEVRPYWGIIGK